MTSTPSTDGWQRPSRRELFALAMNERKDPASYYEQLARVTIEDLPVEVHGRRVLDLGCGGGYDSAALIAAGAQVTAMDLERDGLALARDRGVPALCADANRLPFADATFDGIYSSNVLEHVPSIEVLLDEAHRVLRPGGWAWISWTNWFSPWGGHHIIPLHMLGPRLGPRLWNRLFGPPPKNVPGEGLFPTYVGATLAMVERHPGWRLVDAMPRYYPGHRWILKVPGLREVVTWNCVLVLERSGASAGVGATDDHQLGSS
jgi:SAM-dependent methyltransferase